MTDVTSDKMNPPQKSNAWSFLKLEFYIEVLILTPIILAIIGLFLLPTILYAQRPSSDQVRYPKHDNSIIIGEAC